MQQAEPDGQRDPKPKRFSRFWSEFGNDNESTTKLPAATLSERCYPLNTDSPHVAHLIDSEETARFYLVDITGHTAEDISALLPTAVADMRSRGSIPVFMTDVNDFAVLRSHGVIFEAVPNLLRNQTLMPDMDWQERKAGIIAQVRDKWRPSGELSLEKPLQVAAEETG